MRKREAIAACRRLERVARTLKAAARDYEFATSPQGRAFHDTIRHLYMDPVERFSLADMFRR